MNNDNYFIKIKELIYCPISREIFLEPVLIQSGYTFEKEYIDKWFKNNNTCPLTRKIIDKQYYLNLVLKNIICDFLEKYPEYKNDQYKLNINIDYDKINNADIDYLILYIELYKILNIDFIKINENIFKNDKMMDIIIDNLNNNNNLECENINKWRPIHLICNYSTENIINKILQIYLDKNLDLEYENIYKWRPIHFICCFSTENMINKILDIYLEKNLDLECEDIDKWKSIHYICCFSTENMINKILQIYLDKNLNLECETNNKWKPIHFICRYSTENMINKIINIYCQKNLAIDNKIIYYIELNDNIINKSILTKIKKL
jgi:hypothetical protein